jgi:hypothetical protein
MRRKRNLDAIAKSPNVSNCIVTALLQEERVKIAIARAALIK